MLHTNTKTQNFWAHGFSTKLASSEDGHRDQQVTSCDIHLMISAWLTKRFVGIFVFVWNIIVNLLHSKGSIIHLYIPLVYTMITFEKHNKNVEHNNGSCV